MNKIIKIIKNNILGFIIGAVLFGGIGIALAVQSNIASSDIAYTNSKNANVTSVKQAVDDLYGRVKDNEELSAKLSKYATWVPQFVKSCETSSYLICKVMNAFKGNNVEYGVYYHNGTITPAVAGIDASDTATILDAEDYSFRYAGASGNVKNWVCFGSTATTCPAANKYRIIGVFTFDNSETYHVKLIKNTAYASAVSWDSYSNTWMRPANIRATLNGNYLTWLGDWSSLIYQPTWKVGGANYTDIYRDVSVKTSYTNEMASLGGTYKPTTGTKDASGAYIDNQSKIGLMYISDYGYAAKPYYWKINLNSYSNAAMNYDWIFDNFSNERQWTISRRADTTDSVLYVAYNGDASASNVNYSSMNRKDSIIRPTFYLNSNVEVSSGTGTSSDPWRIKL